MPETAVNGVTIYYEDPGAGSPVLMSHGYGSNSQAWTGQIRAFSPDYRLIAWDNRGHGRSSSPNRADLYSVEHAITDMTGLLGTLGIDRAVVGGLSLGGYLSLQFALGHPEKVVGLVICATGPGFRNLGRRQEWNDRAVDYFEELHRVGLDALGPSPEVQMVKDHHQSPVGLAKAAVGMMYQRNEGVLGRLGQVMAPALVIVGENDSEPMRAGIDYIASHLPNAEKVVIPNAGHAANIDNPEAFNEAVRRFLDDLRADTEW